MPRKSKKKLEELTQTDGKQEKFIPTTLSQIWGDTGLNKYATLDENIYLKQIKGMNLSDLRQHSLKIGIVPAMSRERIEKQLIVKFKQHVSNYRKPINTNLHPKDLSGDKLKKALEVMSAVK
jgi:hypothetical protein